MRTKPTPQEHDILSDDELERIEGVLRDAEDSDVLTQWEEEFVDDLRDRLAEYGTRTRVSAAMWSVIDRIGEKLG